MRRWWYLLCEAERQIVRRAGSVQSGGIARSTDRGVLPPPADDARRKKVADLTPRDVEVLTVVGRGLSNREIAQTLVVAETTVRTHVARVISKLDRRDRAQAVVVAYESAWCVAGWLATFSATIAAP
jgi:DNA-binding NarL/FixJ family response regulator